MHLISRKLIERKARKIEDPIERLRYLRSAAAPAPEGSLQLRRRRKRSLVFGSVAVLLACLLIPGFKASNTKAPPSLGPVTHAPAAGVDVLPDVWLVDKTEAFETYSNGLRVDNRYAVSNQTRVFFPVYQRGAIDPAQPEWRSEIAGIIYHTTESDQAHFDAEQNADLKRIGRQVLTYVQRNHCYHFLIDRFGQVFRVVRESDIANHAGYSVWADNSVIYVNLNSSFLGVAFETQTQRRQDLATANPAQIHAARVLTEMLRSKYHIPASNCVTHAQVSVNPSNMLVGYHTDWAGNFPFREIGLSDNYPTPPASIYAFGFEYDPPFVHATGARIWEGLTLAEDELRSQAMGRGLPVSRYRSLLRRQYKQIIETLKASSNSKENDHAI